MMLQLQLAADDHGDAGSRTTDGQIGDLGHRGAVVECVQGSAEQFPAVDQQQGTGAPGVADRSRSSSASRPTSRWTSSGS